MEYLAFIMIKLLDLRNIHQKINYLVYDIKYINDNEIQTYKSIYLPSKIDQCYICYCKIYMIHNIHYDMHFDIKSTRGAILLKKSWFADLYQLEIPNTYTPMSVSIVLSGTTESGFPTIVLIQDSCYLKLHIQLCGNDLFKTRFYFSNRKAVTTFFTWLN